MAQRAPVVGFPGIADFRRDLKDAAKNIRKAIGRANRRAAKHVAPRVQERYRSVYPRKARRAQFIRARASQKRAAIMAMVDRWPDFFGDEFGANRYPQFRPHRGKQGYFEHPLLRDETDEIIEFYAEAWEEELREAFPDGPGAFLTPGRRFL